MKIYFCSLLAASAICSTVWAGYQVALNETPVAVQNTIRSRAGNAAIEYISRDISNGKVAYTVSLRSNGVPTDFRLNEQGLYIDAQGNALGTAVSTTPDFSRKIAFDEVPLAAQNAIKVQSGRAAIQDVDRQEKFGRTTYTATFNRNGQTLEAKVTEDGRMVANLVDLPPAVQSALRAQAGPGEIQDIEVGSRGSYTIRFKDGHTSLATVSPAGGTILNTSPSLVAQTLGYPEGTKKVTLAEVPALVRGAIEARAAGAVIEDIDRETRNGQTTYSAAFKQNGQTVEATVAEDGALLARMEELPLAVQSSLRAQLGVIPVDRIEKRTLRGQDRYVVRYIQNGQPAQLSFAADGRVLERGLRGVSTGAPGVAVSGAASSIALPDKKVTMAELPIAAQNAIRAQAGGAEIEDIDRKTRDGRTTYEAAFKRSGQNIEITVTEDGTIVPQP
jgi:uncharacterized membrane protein YkoI